MGAFLSLSLSFFLFLSQSRPGVQTQMCKRRPHRRTVPKQLDEKNNQKKHVRHRRTLSLQSLKTSPATVRSEIHQFMCHKTNWKVNISKKGRLNTKRQVSLAPEDATRFHCTHSDESRPVFRATVPFKFVSRLDKVLCRRCGGDLKTLQ